MKRKLLILLLAITTGLVIYLFINRSNPVFYRHVDRASVEYSAFVIFNPFRDRGPERHAEVVLQGLKDRNCQGALRLPALDSARVEYLCEREKKYPLENWSLMDRKVDAQVVVLIYDVKRASGHGKTDSGLVWISLKNDGGWQVISYDTYY